MSDVRAKRDKNQHIQVFVRVRPTNGLEKQNKSPTVVDIASNREVVVRERPQDKLTKKFTFDKVFGPSSKQIDVYNAVASPLLEEVLAGYNCTVFAYGQTGTGKTFTMEGNCTDASHSWQTDSSAGIIPRALSHLFDELRTLGNQEFTVRVSFLELYNEELFDLLSPNDDASKIRIYEDAARKGAIIIHGLEEVTVHNKSEVYKILEKGSEKRQTAATLMNAHSSRSHTVFSITVHIKENTVDGEELLKTGKLNLVDLAGSENVGRSGAVDRRAREAGNINQSLLTLGRVITALVERAPHIPYRESKLTRLLQESLGGRTKTSIIATISPANMNIEETLSTLDYAHRAKNIQNRPEINQKLSKKALLKEYTEEIERLRRDLTATRERNGVYLAAESYNEMKNTIECQSKEIEEKINLFKALEEAILMKEKLFTELKTDYETQNNVLEETKDKLDATKNVLKNTKNQLVVTEYERDLNQHLVEKHVSTEQTLLNQAQTLLKVAETATTDTHKLHDKIGRKKKVEEDNESIGQKFRNDMSQHFQCLQEGVSSHIQDSLNFCSHLKAQVNSMISEQCQGIDVTINHISSQLIQKEIAISNGLRAVTNESHDEYLTWISKEVEKAIDITQQESDALDNLCKQISPRIRELVDTKISENLKSLKKQYEANLSVMAQGIKKSLDVLGQKLLNDRNQLAEQINSVKNSIESVHQKQNRIKEDEDQFSKMFGALAQQFENTWKLYNVKLDHNRQDQSVIFNEKENIRQKCEIMSTNNKVAYDESISAKTSLEEEFVRNVECVKKEVGVELEKNWNLAENVIVQSYDVINQLEGNVNASQQVLVAYKNSSEKFAQIQLKKLTENKDAILAKVKEYDGVMTVASAQHTEFMEQQRASANRNAAGLHKKIDDQSAENLDWNDKMASNLQSTHQKVDKFVVEDLRKDMATGTTPARKEFQFPRYLASTSPHENIKKRFREFRRLAETSDDETMEFSTPKSTTNTTVENSIMSPIADKKNHVTSTPNTHRSLRYKSLCNNSNLIKSASTSDIAIAGVTQLDSTVMSESGVTKRDNKENGDEFLKPVKLKSKLSKSNITNRRILGNYN